VQVLPAYLEHLLGLGLLDRAPVSPLPRRLGGWLKVGTVGTTPATGRVLLVGDAAGLVNPLQGEGIAQAMTSGRSAAEAHLQRLVRLNSGRIYAWPSAPPSPSKGNSMDVHMST